MGNRLDPAKQVTEELMHEIHSRTRAQGVEPANPQVQGIVAEVLQDYFILHPPAIQRDELVNLSILEEISGSRRLGNILRGNAGTNTSTIGDAYSLYRKGRENPAGIRNYGKVAEKHLAGFLCYVEDSSRININ